MLGCADGLTVGMALGYDGVIEGCVDGLWLFPLGGTVGTLLCSEVRSFVGLVVWSDLVGRSVTPPPPPSMV